MVYSTSRTSARIASDCGEECMVPNCGEPAMAKVQHWRTPQLYRMCSECMFQTVAEASNQLDKERLHRIVDLGSVEAVLGEEAAAREQAKIDRQARARTPGWIYYIEIGGVIKIGFATDLKKRFNLYPPHLIVRAVHPGTMEVESMLHKRFADTKAATGREWFEPSPALWEHIAKIWNEFGSPQEQVPHFGSEKCRWKVAA